MKNALYASLVISTLLAGCATAPPPILNSAGQKIEFVDPILGKAQMNDARYVLIEKNIADGKYKLVSISKTRQPITNARQERIAFSNDLTGYAPDYTNYAFQTYVDEVNYDQKTVIMRCGASAIGAAKSDAYSPCNSQFADIFVPFSITKAYVAGRLSQAVKDSWNDPRTNDRRTVYSPRWALVQAGVFQRLGELAAAN